MTADSIVPKIGVKKLNTDTLPTGLYLNKVVHKLNAIDDNEAKYKNSSVALVDVK